MSSSETLPLFNQEKKFPSFTTSSGNIKIAAEVQLPPYIDDGRLRFYATKIWEFTVFFASFFFVFLFDHSERFFRSYIDSSILVAIVVGLTTYFVKLPLAIFIAAIISGRPRSFCQYFYQSYHKFLPQRIDDSLAKFILAED